jgi:DNA-binding transcriptional ArsR family regulator
LTISLLCEIVGRALTRPPELDDDAADELLRAIAHPARRRILLLADGGAVAAGELADAVGLAGATVSEHLKVLRKTGLVTLERDGTWRRYRTDAARLRQLERWLSGLAGAVAGPTGPHRQQDDQQEDR